MVLTGRDIGKRIERGELRIAGAKPEQFQQNGVDLRLGKQVGWLTLDTSGGDVEVAVETEGGVYFFRRGECYLLHTEEVLALPNDLMAFVELRSTWARRGLMMPPTVVDAGFEGDLTLEIFCAGPGVRVPYGERFAHLIFVQLTGQAEPYRGKYQGQRGLTPARED